MKIIIAQYSGFCSGVTRALDITRKSRATNEPVEVLGELVHNEAVVRELSANGIRTIKCLAKNGRGRTLIIRAHGVPQKTLARARAAGYRIIDATCPMVKEIHAIARAQGKAGYRLAIIGDRRHAEVKGIAGQLGRPGLIIDPCRPLPRLAQSTKLAVVVQSTQDIDAVMPIITRLRARFPDMRFLNTICNPTRRKQAEIKTLPGRVDVMLIIGSRSSANTRRLFEISRRLNRRSYWIQTAADIQPAWLKNASGAGVAAGASTPRHIVNQVVLKLKTITARRAPSSCRQRCATRR